VKKSILTAGATLALTVLGGCVSFQNFTAGDLRKPEYAYKEVQIDRTVPQIRQALFEYTSNCRDVGSVKVDPTGERQIVITQTDMGLTRPSVYLLVDISANDKGASLKSYTYYANSPWHGRADEVVSAITDPKTCI
jgi:hypothetical protein